MVVSYRKQNRICRILRAHGRFLPLVLLPVAGRLPSGRICMGRCTAAAAVLAWLTIPLTRFPPRPPRAQFPWRRFPKTSTSPARRIFFFGLRRFWCHTRQTRLPRRRSFTSGPQRSQSLEFTVTSDMFRVATDSGPQYNLEHLPYYQNSVRAPDGGYNLHRWADGDDFIVNDVGHPLQGAVFSRIFFKIAPAVGRPSSEKIAITG